MVDIIWNYYPLNFIIPYWIRVPLTAIFWPFCLLFAIHTIIWNLAPNTVYNIFFVVQYLIQMALSVVIVVLFGPIVFGLAVFFWPLVIPFLLIFIPYLTLKMNGYWFI